eukprot:6167830-Amphidinium_carterae.1
MREYNDALSYWVVLIRGSTDDSEGSSMPRALKIGGCPPSCTLENPWNLQHQSESVFELQSMIAPFYPFNCVLLAKMMLDD